MHLRCVDSHCFQEISDEDVDRTVEVDSGEEAPVVGEHDPTVPELEEFLEVANKLGARGVLWAVVVAAPFRTEGGCGRRICQVGSDARWRGRICTSEAGSGEDGGRPLVHEQHRACRGLRGHVLVFTSYRCSVVG